MTGLAALTVTRGGGHAGPMSSSERLHFEKLPWLKLTVLGAALVAGAMIILRGVDPTELVAEAMAVIRAAGPVVFFAAMAVTPAAGAPMGAFSLTVGEAFGDRFTMTGVTALSMAMVAVNLALTYWLARYALRPVLMNLVARYGYKVPSVTKENALSVALVVRLTPGPPFFFQNYVLALAEMPFRPYMIVSWLGVLPWTVAAVLMGRGILNGNFSLIMTATGLVVVAAVIVHYLRKKYAKRPDQS
jgi:uncharacterized membrane protein YdjX (TVP38/TMEM64 family)